MFPPLGKGFSIEKDAAPAPDESERGPLDRSGGRLTPYDGSVGTCRQGPHLAAGVSRVGRRGGPLPGFERQTRCAEG